MNCTHCGAGLVPGAPACGRCGCPTSNMQPACPRCRAQVHARATQCHSCGLALAPAAPVGAPAQAPAQPQAWQTPSHAQPQPQYAQPQPQHAQAQNRCQRCGVSIPPNLSHCQACAYTAAGGAAGPATVPCPRCRAQVVIGSRFCPSCGFVPGIGPVPPQQKPAGPGLAASFWLQVDKHASLDKLEGFSLREMFSEVFRKRSQDELDDYFQVGSHLTTPDITDVPTGWPKPWFFGRMLLFVGLLYLVQFIAFRQFQNTLMLPGMMITGALAMPFATAILFFELNTPRNVAFIRVLTLLCAGGVLSIFVSLIGFEVSSLHRFLGAPAAGIVEEVGKLIAVVLMVRKGDKLYILNGCLFGAAVGAGFAAFESAGYAFNMFLNALPDKTQGGILFAAGYMVQSILLRGILAPFGHVAWTGITAGVLWRARAQKKSVVDAITDGKFIRAFIIVVLLHATWNFTAGFGLLFGLPFMAFVGVVSWYLVFGIVQQGLRQVRAAQTMTKTGVIRAFDPSAVVSPQ
ncbi:MAG TPA: PrsW family glutamic-type intramembrane protease [Bryobacteraceae bacterium]|nr:PrsW family glutamic-type intramembrane protease [Bryobacteraceae bacterium]